VLHCKRLGDLPVGDFSSFLAIVGVLSLLAH
jgi:hypothetical protein